MDCSDILVAFPRHKCVHVNYCIVLYSFIVQVNRTQLTIHTSSFTYMVYPFEHCRHIPNTLYSKTRLYTLSLQTHRTVHLIVFMFVIDHP